MLNLVVLRDLEWLTFNLAASGGDHRQRQRPLQHAAVEFVVAHIEAFCWFAVNHLQRFVGRAPTEIFGDVQVRVSLSKLLDGCKKPHSISFLLLSLERALTRPRFTLFHYRHPDGVPVIIDVFVGQSYKNGSPSPLSNCSDTT